MDQAALACLRQEVFEQIVPLLEKFRFRDRLAKGAADDRFSHLPAQTMFGHILNAILALLNLVEAVLALGVALSPRLTVVQLRRAIALLVGHDLHKDPDLPRVEPRDIALDPAALHKRWEEWQLGTFTEGWQPSEALLRAMQIGRRSRYQADQLALNEDERMLYQLVRLGDRLASAEDLDEARTIELWDLGPAAGESLALYSHRLPEVRGLLTQAIHDAAVDRLEGQGFRPVLYFPDGVLYLGRRGSPPDRGALVEAIVERLRARLRNRPVEPARLREAWRGKNRDLLPYAYLSGAPEAIVKALWELLGEGRPAVRLATLRARLQGHPALDAALDPLPPHPALAEDFDRALSRLGTFLCGLRAMLEEVGDPRPAALRRLGAWAGLAADPGAIAAVEELYRGGSPLDGHFLAAQLLATADDPLAEAQRVAERVITNVRGDAAWRQRFVRYQDQCLSTYAEDLRAYLREHLLIGGTGGPAILADPWPALSADKPAEPNRQLCAFCGRYTRHGQPARTGLVGIVLRVFSNRTQPGLDAPNAMPGLCRVCETEFILRQDRGLGWEKGEEGLYLFLLPGFSHTPAHLQAIDDVLALFTGDERAPALRRLGDDAPGLPALWLSRRIDTGWAAWEARARAALAAAARTGGRRPFEAVRAFSPRLNAIMLVWRRRSAREAGEPLATELWLKALFLGALLARLLEVRVVIAPVGYLATPDPRVYRYPVNPVGLPGHLEQVFARAMGTNKWWDLARLLDVTAAIWRVTEALQDVAGRPTGDRMVAQVVAWVGGHPLPGSHAWAAIVRRGGRRRAAQVGTPDLWRACERLDHLFGGEMTEWIEKLVEDSRRLFLPARPEPYLAAFCLRKAFDGLRRAMGVVPGVRENALHGRPLEEAARRELIQLATGALVRALERGPRGWPNPERLSRDAWVAAAEEFVTCLLDEGLRRTGQNFAAFLRLENALADALYAQTVRHLSTWWEERKARGQPDEDEV
jgi:hypothetical protein